MNFFGFELLPNVYNTDQNKELISKLGKNDDLVEVESIAANKKHKRLKVITSKVNILQALPVNFVNYLNNL